MKKLKDSSMGIKAGSDHTKELSRINRIKGQIEGIGRMVQNKAYCPEILTQIQAVRSALGSLQAIILANHLEHCVKDKFPKSQAQEADTLMKELLGIFKSTE